MSQIDGFLYRIDSILESWIARFQINCEDSNKYIDKIENYLMKRILNYSNFLEMLLERDLPDNKLSDTKKLKYLKKKSISGITVAKKIVNFLKRHSYKYEPSKDSKVFQV